VAAVEVFGASGDLNSPKAVALVLGLLNRPDAEVRLAAIKAVEDGRVAAAAPALNTFLLDKARAPAERTAVARALRVLNDRRAVFPLQMVVGSDAPAALKAEALRALTALDPAVARTAAQKLLDEPDRAVLAEAVAALGTTRAGARLIAERYLADKLPRDFFPQVTEALKRFENDPALDKLRAEVMRGGLLVSLEPGQIEKVRQLVSSRGDPKRGKDVYLNTKVLACATCHRMEGVGGNTGPDLSRVWDTMSVDKLLESIVDPNKEIKEGYQTYRVVTAAGQVLTGLKVSETGKEVVLRDANGRDTRVDKEDVEQLGPTKLSLMPDNAVAQLSYDQFIDLLAFLKSRTEQESLRGMVLEFAVAGPFSPDVRSDRPEVAASAKGPAWRTVAAESGGVVDLKSAFPSGSTPAGVYARAYVYSPKKQTVTGVVRAEDPLRVWVGDVSVFEQPAAAVMTEQAFRAELDEGWNVVLVKVVNAGKSHRLGLRFAGDGLRTATSPDTTPAAGATNGANSGQ
jgi:putative heme-binding domain-containing protein